MGSIFDKISEFFGLNKNKNDSVRVPLKKTEKKKTRGSSANRNDESYAGNSYYQTHGSDTSYSNSNHCSGSSHSHHHDCDTSHSDTSSSSSYSDYSSCDSGGGGCD